MSLPRVARLLTFMLLVACAWGCSGDSSSPKSAPPPPLAKPSSPQEAIDRLAEGQKKSFENWRRAIIKSCDPAEIFGLATKGLDEPVTGVDLRALLELNGESLLVRATDGSFAVIDQGPAIQEAVSTATEAEGVDAVAVVAEDECTVTLHGQKIFAGPFHESMNVIAFAESAGRPRFSAGRIGMQATNDGGLARLTGSDHSAALRAVFEPDEERAVAWVAAQLGLGHPRLTDLVRAKHRRLPHLSYRWAFNGDSYWFSANEARPLELTSVARAFTEKAMNETRLFAVWELPARNFGGVRNLKDRGPRRFEARVHNRADGTLTEAWRESTESFDGARELSRCLATRATWLLRAEPVANPELTVRPKLEATADPCHVLDQESWKKWDAENAWSTVFPLVLARVAAGPRTDYGGWEHPIFRLVTGLFDRGANPATELDPRGKSAFLAGFVARIGELRARLSLEVYAALRDRRAAYDRMVATWAFEGKPVGPDRLEKILRSTARVMPVLPTSTTTLVNALGPAPEGFDDELEFAAGLETEYLSLVTQVAWRADALDCGWFQEKVIDRIIQRKLPRSELERWNAIFAKISGWSFRYPSLRARQGAMGRIAAELIERGRTDAEVEKTLGALANAINPFDDSTNALIETLESEPTGSTDELVFASELTSAYKAKAVAVRKLALEIGLTAWTKDFWRSILQRRPSASQLEEMNRALAAGERFSLREKERLGARRENPQDRKRIELLVTAIDENWSDAEFAVLEAVAPFAAFKEICNHQSVFRTISARADCLGLENFSARPRKILFPGFSGRYGPFAEAVKAELDLHAVTEIIRPEFVNLFFQRGDEPAWSACDAEEFFRRSKRALELLVALRNEPDPRKREPIRIAFRDGLKNCTSLTLSSSVGRGPRSVPDTPYLDRLPGGAVLSSRRL